MNFPLAIVHKFWARVVTAGPEDCWPWTGVKNAKGYGHFSSVTPYVYAHRFALMLSSGTTGEVAMHTCDNPSCCNPAHLKWGTDSDNMRDARDKGRRPQVKLTPAQVAEMKALMRDGAKPKEVGPLFGVAARTACDIRCGNRWPDIEPMRSENV